MSQPAGPVRLAGLHLKLGVLNELQYRANFWVQLVNSVVALGTGIVAIVVVFSHTDTLGGWSAAELLTVMGVHLAIGGVLKTLVQPNIWRLLEDVQEGTLDYTLTRPADSQLLVSVREVSLWSSVDIFIGIGVVVYALNRMTSDVGAAEVLGFLLALVCGALIIYAIWISAATFAFKAVRIDNLIQLLNGVYEAGCWPVGIYPGWLRGALTFILPLAFAITVPAEIVSGRVNWWWLALGVVVTVIALIGCRLIWRWVSGTTPVQALEIGAAAPKAAIPLPRPDRCRVSPGTRRAVSASGRSYSPSRRRQPTRRSGRARRVAPVRRQSPRAQGQIWQS